ncbi:MAG TPA: hypothetical protein VER96_16820 [Polyangiaceae bacterium]|nr:hypothetical protein [Polyangiaceae bacterium]
MTFSANGRRPLFVPPGIPVVRTGPTTRAEFERLFDDERIEQIDHSAIRPIPGARAAQGGLFQAVADALQLIPGKQRSRR